MWIGVRTLAVPKGSMVSNYFLGCLEPSGMMQKNRLALLGAVLASKQAAHNWSSMLELRDTRWTRSGEVPSRIEGARHLMEGLHPQRKLVVAFT